MSRDATYRRSPFAMLELTSVALAVVFAVAFWTAGRGPESAVRAVGCLLLGAGYLCSWLFTGIVSRRPSTPWRLHATIFVGMAVPFALQMAGFGLLIGAPWRWAGFGVAAVVAFGVLMSLILGWIARASTRDLGATVPAVVQERVLELPGDRESVLARVGEALGGLPRARRVRVDAETGSVRTRTEWSWKSFGEVVTARVEPTGPDRQTVRLESRPAFRGTIVDYGANARNMMALTGALEAPAP